MHGLPLLVFKSWIQISTFCMFCLDIRDLAIITVKNVDYRRIINNISKSETINLSESAALKNRGYI